jgi:hypothetical protein
MALPGDYAPTRIAAWATGVRKPLLHDKAVVLREDVCQLQMKNLAVHIEYIHLQHMNSVPKIVNHIWLQ